MTQLAPDMDGVSAFVKDVVATEIMPLFRNLCDDDIEEKTPGDYVTAADKGAEIALSKILTQRYPGSVVMGEETLHRNKHVVQALKDGDPVWVIDPIDGTGSFKNGEDGFGLMLCLVQNGMPQQSWIYQPVQDRMIMAERGNGASVDGQHLKQLAKMPPLPSCNMVLGKLGLSDEVAGRLQQKLGYNVASYRNTGACAIEYPKLAMGETDFALYSLLYTWDHAAGVLTFQEAGGKAAHLTGKDYDPLCQHGCLLMARNEDDWQKIKTALFSDSALLSPSSTRFAHGPILSRFLAS